MHHLQKELLKRLVYQDHRSFADLTWGFNQADNIAFHLKKLLSANYVQKEQNRYHLAPEGLKVSGTFDLATLEDKKFKVLYQSFIVRWEDKFLLREKISGKKTFYKLPGGKAFYGETTMQACQRLFQQETGALLAPQQFDYHCTHLRKIVTTQGELLFDDVTFFYMVDLAHIDPRDFVLRMNNRWIPQGDVANLEGKWTEIDMCLLGNNWQPFAEYECISDYNLTF